MKLHVVFKTKREAWGMEFPESCAMEFRKGWIKALLGKGAILTVPGQCVEIVTKDEVNYWELV